MGDLDKLVTSTAQPVHQNVLNQANGGKSLKKSTPNYSTTTVVPILEKQNVQNLTKPKFDIPGQTNSIRKNGKNVIAKKEAPLSQPITQDSRKNGEQKGVISTALSTTTPADELLEEIEEQLSEQCK